MIRKEYAIFEVLDRSDNKGILFESVLSGWGIEPRIGKNIYAKFAYKPEENKTYLFTDTTMERLSSMSFEGLEPADIVNASQMSATEKGFVLTGGTHQKLHFCYVVSPGQVVISVMQGKIKTAMSNHELGNTLVGNIIIDESDIHLSPTNTLTPIFRLNKFRDSRVDVWLKYICAMSQDTALNVKKLMKHIMEIVDDKTAPVTDILLKLDLRNDPKFQQDELIQRNIKDYDYRYGLLVKALKMFLFLKCADITKFEYVNEDTLPKLSYLRGVKRMNYTVVDSTWDKEITVNNPFVVRGHFRLQPIKDGKRLIYIDSYWKKGYHRRSGAEINEQNPEIS